MASGRLRIDENVSLFWVKMRLGILSTAPVGQAFENGLTIFSMVATLKLNSGE